MEERPERGEADRALVEADPVADATMVVNPVARQGHSRVLVALVVRPRRRVDAGASGRADGRTALMQAIPTLGGTR